MAPSCRSVATATSASGNVFNDGTSLQIATMTGDTANGNVATLQVGIAT